MTLLSTSFFKRVKVVSKQASAAIMLQMKPIIHENKPPVVCFFPSGKDLGITALQCLSAILNGKEHRLIQ